jgi:hypothetical protein
MEPDGKDDAAALMVLAFLVIVVLAVMGIGAYLAFAQYTSAASGI